MFPHQDVGKTTILRDLIRQISDGIDIYNFKGKTIGVADERGELAAIYKGVSQNNLGIHTDIMNNIPKSIGMEMLIRSMSPEVIVADEIGKKEDIDAINYAICSGIKGIFTAHGKTLEDLELNKTLEELINNYLFERIIFLNSKEKGKIEKVYRLDKKEKQYVF